MQAEAGATHSCGVGSSCACVATCTGPVDICVSTWGGACADWEYTVTGTCSAPGGGTVDHEAVWRIETPNTPLVHFFYDELAIEYRDGGVSQRIPLVPGEAGWDEPTERVHRGVNVGGTPYEEVTVFFLDREDAEPQPAP